MKYKELLIIVLWQNFTNLKIEFVKENQFFNLYKFK